MKVIKKIFSTFFSFVAGLLTLACPVCFPLLGVGTLLSAVGLGFLVSLGANIYFIGSIFIIAWLFLFFSARQHLKYWILIPSVVGGGLILIGRFVFINNPMIYAGIVFFLGAALLNLKFKRGCCEPKGSFESK